MFLLSLFTKGASALLGVFSNPVVAKYAVMITSIVVILGSTYYSGYHHAKVKYNNAALIAGYQGKITALETDLSVARSLSAMTARDRDEAQKMAKTYEDAIVAYQKHVEAETPSCKPVTVPIITDRKDPQHATPPNPCAVDDELLRALRVR